MSEINAKSADATLEWVLKRERALHYEYKMYDFISQFAVDFILSSIERNKFNINRIKTEQDRMRSGLAEIKKMGDKNFYSTSKQDYNRSMAALNIAKDNLDNCSVILDRMEEYIIANGKNYNKKETA